MSSSKGSPQRSASLAAVTAVAGLLLVADVVVIALRGTEASAWEWLMLGVALLGVASLFVLLVWGGLQARRWLQRRIASSHRARIVLDALPLALAELVCAGLLFLPVWSELATLHQILSVVGAVGLVLGIVLASALLHAHHTILQKGSAIGGMVVCVCLYSIDATVLVGLYPAFHAGLFLAVVWFGCLSAAVLLEGRIRLPAHRVLPVLGVAALHPLFALTYLPETALRVATNGVVSGQLLEAGRAVSDFDADGYSSLFGGGDCAAFRSDVSPEGFDVPGNGIDEDCTGADLADEDVATERTTRYPLPGGPYNVALILVDALRADHIGALGYARKTTPNIDRLASKAQVFSRAYAQSPKTGTSVPSILTGRIPSNAVLDFTNRRLKSHVGILHRSYVTLTEHLHAAGYRTALGAGTDFYRRYHFAQGFDRVSKIDFGHLARTARKALRKGKKPVFLMLHVMHPHLPHERHPEHDFGTKPVDLYDGEVAAADAFVGSLIDQLTADKLLERTIFIISADHGESLGEMGRRNHIGVHEETLHVPLIMYVPGLEHRVFDDVTPLVDILPTVLELVGLPEPLLLDGVSRAPEFFGVAPTTRSKRAAVSQRRDRRGLVESSVVRGAYRLTVRDGGVELIDVTRDREGRDNLAQRRPELTREMRELLASTTQATDSALIRRAQVDEAGLERLRRHVHLLGPPEQLGRALDIIEKAGDGGIVEWTTLIERKDLPKALRKRIRDVAEAQRSAPGGKTTPARGSRQ